MQKNNWKAIVNVKENISKEENNRANVLIEHWKAKLGIEEKVAGEFFQIDPNNELPTIVCFTHKLKNESDLFSKISVIDLQSQREDRFI